jgi:co-chaperonin GroES (HSP10)
VLELNPFGWRCVGLVVVNTHKAQEGALGGLVVANTHKAQEGTLGGLVVANTHKAQEGALGGLVVANTSGETSVGTLQARGSH